MPFDFDSEYGGEDDEQQTSDAEQFAAVADRAVAQTFGNESEDEDDQSYMSEVDKRLEITTYYRELLRGSLFDQATEASQIVEREVRNFVRRRLETLLGIRPEEVVPQKPAAVELPFSKEQITALQLFANRLITRDEEPKKPEVRKITAPEPKPAPLLRKAAQPPKAEPQAAIKQAREEAVRKAPPAPPPEAPAKAPAAATKPQKGGKKALAQTKEVVNDEGKTVTITNPRIQRPAGQAPFPDATQMSFLLESQAHNGLQIGLSNIGNDTRI